MARFDQLKNLVMSLESDFDKFYSKDNQAAGTRVRQGMQELKTLAQEIRLEVQEMKNKKEGVAAAPAKKKAAPAKKK